MKAKDLSIGMEVAHSTRRDLRWTIPSRLVIVDPSPVYGLSMDGEIVKEGDDRIWKDGRRVLVDFVDRPKGKQRDIVEPRNILGPYKEVMEEKARLVAEYKNREQEHTKRYEEKKKHHAKILDKLRKIGLNEKYHFNTGGENYGRIELTFDGAEKLLEMLEVRSAEGAR